jgi:hypothetical protein
VWWPEQDPIGRQLKLGEDGEWITVIGVVEDVNQLRAGRFSREIPAQNAARGGMRPLPLLFRPMEQEGPPPAGWEWGPEGVVVAARTSGDPGAVTSALVREMGSLAPDLPLLQAGTLLDIQLSEGWARDLRVYGGLVAAVGTVGILLALLGVSAVVADAISRRTREVGIRKAIGASNHQVTWLLARESLLLAIVGLVGAGLLILLLAIMFLEPRRMYFPYLMLGDALSDWRVLSLAPMTILCVTALTALLCARRGKRIEPAVALRME